MANVFLGATQSFSAAVSNTTNMGVGWSVSGAGCAGAQCGTIDVNGLYTAPRILPSPPTITLRATSQADLSRSGTATVTLTSDVSVSVMPPAQNVELGAMLQFMATVTGSGNPNLTVTWELPCGAPCGSITGAGVYTAPSILPAPATVNVVARSVADGSKTGNASVTVTSNLTVSVSGPASVNTGQMAQFTATVTPAPGSNPDTNVNWSVNGIPGGDSTVGMITSSGLYTAPLLSPTGGSVMVTATSRADASKTAMQDVAVNNVITVSVSPSPSADVALEASQQFTATVAGTANTAVVWDVNGIVGGDQNTVGAISQGGLYFAPVNKPGVGVTVRATSQADASKSASASVNLFSTIQVTVSPGSATRTVNHRQTLSISVANTSNPRVVWRVNGIAGGDAGVGMICVSGFDPCSAISGFTSDPTVDYLAPTSVAGDTQFTISATSEADPSMAGTAQVLVIATVRVSVLPANSTLPAGGTQTFFASVLGTDDQRVTWAVNGIANGDSTVGMICLAGVDPCMPPAAPLAGGVEYRAPAAPPPNPPVVVTARSAEDTAQAGSGNVNIATGPFIQTLRPSSFFANDGNSLSLRVQGLNFVAGSSTILFNGEARATNCTSATFCTTLLSTADFNAPGDKAVQVENPGSPAVQSNQVVMRVLAPDTTEDVIALTAGNPAVTGKDIVVAESFGAAPPNITLIGLFSQGSCNAFGVATAVTRPAAGTRNVDVCVTSSTPFTDPVLVTISGPTPNDIATSNVLNFGVTVVVTLTLSSTTAPGPRTLFVEVAGHDKAAASGALEVK